MIDRGTEGNNGSQSDNDPELTFPTASPHSNRIPPALDSDDIGDPFAAPPEEPADESEVPPAPEGTARTQPTSSTAPAAPAASGLTPGPGLKEGDLILGRYRVDGELGKGGMGVVYRCTDLVGDVRVAVKTIPPEISWNAQEMEEIRDNFRLVERLHHPHITDAKTIERDPQNGQFFLVMELADGVNLRQYRKKKGGTLPIEECINLGRQIASALDYGHSEMIIHRDIKPSNIMITDSGKVKVLDYGIASQYHESMSRVTNAKYETSGTGPYMAPEQWMGEFQDAKTDQYALAVLLYELYDGKPPFSNPDLQILGQAVRKDPPPKPEGMSGQTWAAFRKALSKKRKDRFNSCSEFVTAVEESLGGLESITAKRKVRYGIMATAAVLVILLGLTGVLNAANKSKANQLHQEAVAAVELRDWANAERLLARSLSLHARHSEAQTLLDRVRKRGSISLTSQPSGADVYVQGRRLGATPMLLDQLPGESLVFELRANGYRPYRQSMTVRENRTEEHHVSLLGEGLLRVTSNPEGAAISLNGRDVGRTPANLSGLESGEYAVKITHDGFRPQEQTIQFAANQSRDLNFGALTPLHGAVTIETTPRGATVKLGSESRTSPATFSHVPAGTHPVTVELAGYEARSDTLSVQDGDSINRNWILTRVAEASPETPTTGAALVTAGVAGSVSTPAVAERREAPRAATPQPASPDEPAQRARVVVAPASFDEAARIRFIREAASMFDLTATVIAESPGFTRHLTDALFHLRAFDMLERDALNTVLRELDFGDSDYVDPNQAVKMGQMLNADYVIVPAIQSLFTTVETREVPIVNRTRTSLKGHIGIHVRVVDVRTSRIVSSWQRQIDLEERVNEDSFDRERQGLQFINRLYEQAAREAGREIVDTVYPLRIVAMDGRQVTLNRGRGAVQVGDVFSVFKQGDPIVDPDTQDPLGFAEEEVGEIRVTQVLPRISIAEIQGEPGPIDIRDICRPKQVEEQRRPPSRAPRID